MVDRLDQQAHRQALSDLMDGAADADAAATTCEAWRRDGAVRGDWYAYHLIGDVLRSEDLAHPPERDELFLSALRVRLSQEPVVLAPQPERSVPAPAVAPLRVANGAAVGGRSLWRRSWVAPSAVAAGFMAVAGVLVVTRVADAPSAAPVMADARSLVAPLEGDVRAVSTVSAPPVAVPVANGKLIRDARLDRYLAAHKQYGGSSMLAMPAVAVSRSAVPAAADR